MSDQVTHGTPRSLGGGNVEPVANHFAIVRPPTILADGPGFVLIESVAGAGSVKVRQHLVFTGDTSIHSLLRFENDGAVAITNARFGWADDIDVNDPACCDNTGVLIGDDVDIGLRICGLNSPMCLTLVGDRAMRSYDLHDDHGTVFGRLRQDAFTNSALPGVQDFVVGAVYDRAAVADDALDAEFAPLDVVTSVTYVLP